MQDQAVVASLGRLAHPNIISLLGYGDVNRLDCLLVYNYTNMQNQNFSRFLFGGNILKSFSKTIFELFLLKRWYDMNNIARVPDVVAPLSWETRLMIMIGVARGLAYMHSSPEQVIHGGIKTFNIFLDQVLLSYLCFLVAILLVLCHKS